MDNEEQSAILSGRAFGLRDGATKEKFDIAMKMAQWKDEQFAAEKQALIDNACEILESIIFDKVDTIAYDKDGVEFVASMDGKEFADFFRKVMEA